MNRKPTTHAKIKVKQLGNHNRLMDIRKRAKNRNCPDVQAQKRCIGDSRDANVRGTRTARAPSESLTRVRASRPRSVENSQCDRQAAACCISPAEYAASVTLKDAIFHGTIRTHMAVVETNHAARTEGPCLGFFSDFVIMEAS